MLSTQVLDLEDPEARQEMVTQSARGSVQIWRHVNFTGEYDFTKIHPGASPVPLSRIQALKLG